MAILWSLKLVFLGTPMTFWQHCKSQPVVTPASCLLRLLCVHRAFLWRLYATSLGLQRVLMLRTTTLHRLWHQGGVLTAKARTSWKRHIRIYNYVVVGSPQSCHLHVEEFTCCMCVYTATVRNLEYVHSTSLRCSRGFYRTIWVSSP
jgi:hypothetical protein